MTTTHRSHEHLTATALPAPPPEAAPRSLLRLALKLDAVVSGANGVAYLVAAEPLGDLLGHAPSLLRGVGAFFVVFAAGVWLTATRERVPRPAVLAIVAGNAAWVLVSLGAALAGWGSPTTAGTVWTVLQAVTVAAFADLQAVGLRRAATRG
jgi:hypothetical protein